MPFNRERVRHPLTMRRATVSAVRRVIPSIVRVTLTGAELDGFNSPGPADHVKVFFPDPATGVLTTPIVTPDGTRRPDTGVIISRDYTPLAFRPAQNGPVELDLDFVVHGDEGPASAWAARAQLGDELAIAGPRGSRLVPEDIERVILIADETALPVTRRWLEAVSDSVAITAIFDVADERAEGYFAGEDAPASAEWLYREDAPGQLDDALRSLGPIGEKTFVFLAGEATTLVPLRRYLRRELALPAEQVSVSGYWKRGVTNLDHHAPVDPTDPD